MGEVAGDQLSLYMEEVAGDQLSRFGELPLHVPHRSPQQQPLPTITIESSGSMKVSTVNPCMDGMDIETLNGFSAGGNQVGVNPQDAWLPITESRDGNFFSAVFHLINSGIGFQALLLPFAFTALGWKWGIISLSVAFVWQLYTIWLLVQLAESVPGIRFSRYLHLAIAAFGPKLGKLLVIFPVMYLSGGSCVMIIITAGGNMGTFYEIMCGGGATCEAKSLSGTLWFLVFTCMAIAIAQLPNLNSITKVSLIGSITALVSCTLIWVLPLTKSRPSDVSYDPAKEAKSDMAKFGNAWYAIGIILLSFRGHNLVLEIQGTLPSNCKQRSCKPMWRAVIVSYILIAMCLFPLAIAGFWAFGNKVPSTGGLLIAFREVHGQSTSKYVMGLIYLMLLINSLSIFQIYAMPVFDNLEFRYTSMKKQRCPQIVRTGFRLFFGGLAFFIAVAFPFLGRLSVLIGGLTLPLTYVYPCFMYNCIKKSRPNGVLRWLNMALGCLGIVLGVLLVVAAAWNFSDEGLHANFFKP